MHATATAQMKTLAEPNQATQTAPRPATAGRWGGFLCRALSPNRRATRRNAGFGVVGSAALLDTGGRLRKGFSQTARLNPFICIPCPDFICARVAQHFRYAQKLRHLTAILKLQGYSPCSKSRVKTMKQEQKGRAI